MAAILTDIQDAVLAAIVDKRDNTTAWPAKSRWGSSGSNTPGFVLSKFQAARSWMPRQELKDIPEGGQVWVIGLSADDTPTQGRGNTSRKEVPVQIALHKRINKLHENDEIDTLVELEEQIREVCRLEVDPALGDFSWIRNESLKDENETPFSFVGLREGNFFEAYFTAYFNIVLP